MCGLHQAFVVAVVAAGLLAACKRTDNAGDYAGYASCVQAAQPCEVLACVDRFESALGSAHAAELATTRILASKACKQLNDEQAFAAFSHCLASKGPCERNACGKGPTGDTHAADALRMLSQAEQSCKAAAAPNAEQAARAFLNRYFYTLGSDGKADKEMIADLYVRNPTIEGVSMTRDDVATRRSEAISQFEKFSLEVRQDTVELNCESSGRRCQVSGVLDVRHTTLGDHPAGSYESRQFELHLVDVKTNPKVMSEKESPPDLTALLISSGTTDRGGSVAPAPPTGGLPARPFPLGAAADTAPVGPSKEASFARSPAEHPNAFPAATEPPTAQGPAVAAPPTSAGDAKQAMLTPWAGANEVPEGPTVSPKPVEPVAAPSASMAHPCDRKDALGTSREVIVNAPEGGLHIGLESYNRTLKLNPKEVVLTFDDGPNPGTTERVLDALNAECVKATFFLIGRNAQAHPELVKQEIREGHTIGYHTWSHPARTLAGIPKDDAIEEIERGFAAVDKAGYDRVARDRMPKTPWFRFPGFADTKETLEWLDKRRITVFGADFWAADWIAMSPEAELNLVMKHLHEKGGGIVLLHDARAQTAKMLPAFLRTLKDEGYQVVHIEPGDPSQTPLRDAGPGWKSETEEIVAKVMPRLLKLPPYTPDGGGGGPAPE